MYAPFSLLPQMAIMTETTKKEKLSIIIKGHVDSEPNLCVLKDRYISSSLVPLSSFWVIIWWDDLHSQSVFNYSTYTESYIFFNWPIEKGILNLILHPTLPHTGISGTLLTKSKF